MNDKTLKALDRALDRLERTARREPRRGRSSTAPLVLALGLILGYQLLARLVPVVWTEFVQQGVDQARQLGPWAKLVASLSVACRSHFTGVVVVIATITGLAFLAVRAFRPLRFLVLLAAVAVLLLDAAMLYVVLGAGIESTLAGAGF